jgi:hypothetical protein
VSRTTGNIPPQPANLVGAYGLLNVLDRLRTKVRELQRQDFPHLIIGHTGDAQPPSPRKRLQPLL